MAEKSGEKCRIIVIKNREDYMGKIEFEDLFELVKEMEAGAKDKSRTIKDISNEKVKEMVRQESKQAIDLGVTSAISTTVATSTLVGTIGGAGSGIISTGISAMGITAMSATGGAAAGGTVGSAIPVVGVIVGAVIGAGIGVAVGEHINKEKEQKKERLMQEVLSKQNTIIRSLERELDALKKNYGEAVKQNDRYKYIIGILMANEELKKFA